jgi:uncharacterized protein YecE (DUF72 family)
MSVNFDKIASGMVNTLVHAMHQGPGDTTEAAMHRVEKFTKGEVPYNFVHRCWYRGAKPDVPTFFALLKGYRAVLAAGHAAYNAERMRVPADAQHTILARLAALVAPAEDPPPK